MRTEEAALELELDVTGYGDLRDLAREGRKALRGEPVDQLTVGLAAVGLTLTAATVLSVGAVLPAHNGASAVKARWTRSGTAAAAAPRSVVRVPRRRLTPRRPACRRRRATRFWLTRSPASRRSARIRGAPYVSSDRA